MLSKNIRNIRAKMTLVKASQAAFHSSAPMNEVVSNKYKTIIILIVDCQRLH